MKRKPLDERGLPARDSGFVYAVARPGNRKRMWAKTEFQARLWARTWADRGEECKVLRYTIADEFLVTEYRGRCGCDTR